MTVVDGRVEAVAHHAFDVLRWKRVEIDVTGAAGVEAVLNRARLLFESALLSAEDRFLVIRVTLIGETPAHADLATSPKATLEQFRGLASELAARDELWIECVVIDTRPALDLAAMRDQPGPIGTLITALDRNVAIDAGLKAFVADQLKRADGTLPVHHPANAIAAGHISDDLLQKARALVLAELGRR